MIALVTVAFSTLAVGGSYYWYQGTVQLLAQARSQLAQIRSTQVQLEAEDKDLALHQSPYRDLVRRSIIGREQRLNWRDTLEAEKLRSGITHLNYTLLPRQPLYPEDSSGGLAGTTFKPYRSSMTLELGFPRETALVDFLEHLTANAPALSLLRSCDLARPHQPGEMAPEVITATCHIDWVTIEDSTQERKAPRR